MRRNEAAVDSELALLPLIEERLPLSGPLRNPAYGVTNAALLHPTNGILVVTRLDGPSPHIARGLVDKALEAERNGLWGRAYFDLRNTSEPGYKAGDEMIRTASEITRHLGFETVVDQDPGTYPVSFPMSQIAISAGWYDENVSGPFTLANVEFMPGAFAYHLHSYSAASLRTTNRFWVGPLLSKGAGMTMGSVDEPYLGGTPDIAVFLSRLIMHGFSFGEAAIASQSFLSWQTTAAGDPLYRPFAKNPDELQKELLERKSRLVEWSFLRLVNLNQINGLPLQNCASLLEQTPLTRESAVLTEKLGDLYEALGKPSSAAHARQQALKLDPSPQQRLRLLLTLGERLGPLGREAEAYEALGQVLQAFPDYADRLSLCRKLAALARKLGKTAEAERFEAEINRLSPPAKAPGTAN
jgi:uncharacterized protein (TIGR03790 family)